MSKELEYLSHRVALGRLSRRDFLGRAAALGIAAPFAGSLLASAAHAAGPQRGGIMRAGLVGGESTNSLDPATFMTQVPFAFGKMWGEYLVQIRQDGGLEHRLAEDYGADDDALVWTFKIRRGVEFHNGKTVTAEDVAQTLIRHSNEESKSGALGIMRGIDRVRAEGDDLIVELKEANADLPYLMTDYHLIIQPNGGMDNPAEGISAGPYRVVVDEPGIRHVGERFENFWQPDKEGFADQVEVIVMNDATARTSALQSGQVHMINRVEPRIVSMVSRAPGVKIVNFAGPSHYVFIMHCNTAPFDNRDLRMALKLAMDRQQMVDTILHGYGSIGNDIPVNASYPLFPDDIPQREFDPDQAKFYYEKSGHDGPILLRTSEVAFPGAVDAALLYQESCAKAGIPIEVRREPGDGYWSEVWNVQPFSTSYWGGRPTQDQMYSTAYLSTADWNDTRFHNEQFDQLLIAARAELDQDKRKQMYRDMAMIVHNEGGLICPMFNDLIDAVSDKVQGFTTGRTHELMDGYALARCWLES